MKPKWSTDMPINPLMRTGPRAIVPQTRPEPDIDDLSVPGLPKWSEPGDCKPPSGVDLADDGDSR